jgi:hypothetical protein
MYISFGIAKPRNKQYLAVENTDSFGSCHIAAAKMPRHTPPTWRCDAPQQISLEICSTTVIA